MEKLKIKLNTILTIVMLAGGCGVWWLLKAGLPTHYFTWYPVIPGFFYIMGLVFVTVVTRDYKENQRKLVNLYMIIKLCKVTAALLFAGIYYLVEREQMRDFIDENDRIIEAYRDRFKRLRFMVENSFSVGDIMELLVAVE